MTNAELYVQHLDSITGRREDVIRQAESTDPRFPPVSVFIYKNWPEDGLITGFTFGLSVVDHPDWKLGKPDLMSSVESASETWALAVVYMAESLRGKCPFCFGNTINFRTKISREESDLDAFLVFAPLFVTKDQNAVKLRDYTCNIIGVYPLYSSESSLYEELGLKRFWNLPGWDPLNVSREPLA